jgi:tetratricopeptide (TPR) repeat protein
MQRIVLGLFVSALIGAALWPRLASAQEPSIAEALFRAGRQAMKASDYETACAKFRESNRLDPSAGTQLNLGECEEKLGHLAAAWELYQRVVRALPPSDERQRIARADADALEPRVSRVVLVASKSAPPDLEILNGAVRLTASSLTVPIPVDPGRHEFTVAAPGYTPRVYRMRLAPGELRSLVVAPGPRIPDPESARARRERALKWTWGVTSLGIAGATFAVAGVSTVIVLRKKAIVEDPQHCDAARLCDATGVDAGHTGRAFSLVATLSTGVGLAALGTGAYLLLSRPRTSEPGPEHGSSLSLRVATLPLPGGGGLSLSSSY